MEHVYVVGYLNFVYFLTPCTVQFPGPGWSSSFCSFHCFQAGIVIWYDAFAERRDIGTGSGLCRMFEVKVLLILLRDAGDHDVTYWDEVMGSRGADHC